MKRFELVKEYPGSPKIGTIAVAHNDGYRIMGEEGDGIISFIYNQDGEDFMSRWGEFWKDADRDKRTISQKLEDLLNTANGEEVMENFRVNLEKEYKQMERNEERFKRMVGHTGLENLIEKIIIKYNSDNYKNREYKAGYLPREPLCYLLYKYFVEYGEETQEGVNEFMVCNYRIGKYLVGIMHGQGSVVVINKVP